MINETASRMTGAKGRFARATTGTASASTGSITLNAERTGVMGGTYAGSVTFSATVNGDHPTATLPVTLNLEAHRLLASDTGVAFATTIFLENITRTLTVRDNLGLNAAWTATSDQPWLTATPSVTAPGNLTLFANATSLAPNQVFYATVTLTSTDPTVEGPERIRIGFWTQSTPLVATVSFDATTAVKELVTDPIRPEFLSTTRIRSEAVPGCN